MIVFDAHLDLAWNAIDFNRDLLRPVAEIRQAELSQPELDFKGRGRNTVSFPELRRARVGTFIATLLARIFRPTLRPPIARFSSMEAACAVAEGQMAYYRVLVDRGELNWITDWKGLSAHIESWRKWDASGGVDASPPLGFILSMEGADPILSPKDVEKWYDMGLRIVGPAHYGVSPYAHGTGTVGGLFPPGPDLLKEMQRVGMILDVTHLSDQCFDEALDLYGGPVLASHHNCRTLVPDQRQLTDDQIKRLISRGAVIGAALDAWMLYPNWIRGQTQPKESGVTMETYVDHLDRVCQLAGNAKHAAIGTDLDGGFGTEQTPHDLDTIFDLGRVPELLRKRGYTESDVEGIMHGNWVRFFREAWGG